MKTISYSAFRMHLAATLDEVNEVHKPILITRQTGYCNEFGGFSSLSGNSLYQISD